MSERAVNWRSPNGLTESEMREVRAAYERDRWAGEWNSLPTAIDRVLEAFENGPGTHAGTEVGPASTDDANGPQIGGMG